MTAPTPHRPGPGQLPGPVRRSHQHLRPRLERRGHQPQHSPADHRHRRRHHHRDRRHPDPAADITGTLSGDGAPQAGIAVRVYLAGTGTLAGKTVTAADGTYTVATLAAGASYQVRFSDTGQPFAIQWAVGATKQSHATTYTLDAGTPTIVNATLVDSSGVTPPGALGRRPGRNRSPGGRAMAEAVITEADVASFRDKLDAWVSGPGEQEQAIVAMIAVRAFPEAARAEVEGYEGPFEVGTTASTSNRCSTSARSRRAPGPGRCRSTRSRSAEVDEATASDPGTLDSFVGVRLKPGAAPRPRRHQDSASSGLSSAANVSMSSSGPFRSPGGSLPRSRFRKTRSSGIVARPAPGRCLSRVVGSGPKRPRETTGAHGTGGRTRTDPAHGAQATRPRRTAWLARCR